MSWGKCKYCGERIVWAQMPGGNWLPMEPGTGEHHECCSSSPTIPQTNIRQEYHWEYSQNDMCRPTICPKCKADVYFVRHNGGSVWFDELGPPWPKHSCFEDEPIAALLRSKMRLVRDNEYTTFGILTHVAEDDSGHHHYVIQCADSSKIDSQFESGWDLPSLPGALVQVIRDSFSMTIERLEATNNSEGGDIVANLSRKKAVKSS